MRKKLDFLLLFLPWLLILLLFTYVVVAWNILISFTDWGLVPSYEIVGLQNYIALPDYHGFETATWNTVKILLCVPIAAGLAAGLAAILEMAKGKVSSLLRAAVLIPFAVAPALTGMVWYWMYHPDFGVMNSMLRSFGLGNVDWIGSASIVFFSILIMLLWRFVGYSAIIFLGGMKSIAQTQLDSARICGASKWQEFRHIIFPQLRGHFLLVLLLLSVFFVKNFAYIWTLTGGGPGTSSYFYPIMIYFANFYEMDVGMGAAGATLLLVMMVTLGVLYVRYAMKK